MTLINTSILMLVLQPLFVYLALFKNVEQPANSNTSIDNENSMYLFIAPGLSVFYINEFWESILYLGGICLVGLLLAKCLQHKAQRKLTKGDALGFTVSSFIFFGTIKLIMAVVAYFSNGDADSVSKMDDLILNDQPFSLNQLFSLEYLYNTLWPTIYFLYAALALFIIKLLRPKNDELVSILLVPLAIAAGIFPLFGGGYILCMIINFFVYIFFCQLCLFDKSDPSGSGVMIFYGYILVVGAGGSILLKVIYELTQFI